MILIDAHLDLGMNALLWNRDLRLSIKEIREQEREMTGPGRGRNTVSLPELARAKVALCLGTVLARTGGAPTANLPSYRSAEIAYGMARGQFAYYRALERLGDIRILISQQEVAVHLEAWEAWDAQAPGDEAPPLGLVVSMEGADAIPSPDFLEPWWQAGLRVIGLTHYQEGSYAYGTGSEGGIKPAAKPLLEEMQRLGFILDLTHLADESFWEVLELWQGPVMASHNNCRALVPGQRQFSDEQLKAIIARDGVIGGALDAWMLYPGWVRGETSPEVVGLEALVDHLEHICTLAGNARHAAIGSDLDGSFGTEQTPRDLDTIADLQRLPQLMKARGFQDSDISAIMWSNWARFLQAHLPGA